MRLVTIEEHVLNPAVAQASAATATALNPHWAAAFSPESGLPYTPSRDVLTDLDQGRLADMDKHGISLQVLSNLSTQQVPADVAPDLVRSANDTLAAAVRRHPDRFAAFAALPTTVPEAAAVELERCVSELGFQPPDRVLQVLLGQVGGSGGPIGFSQGPFCQLDLLLATTVTLHRGLGRQA